ncbi:tyrosine-type recombinase/integrase [Fundidesulfovibrio agrisoli]|uniref:tyrosine-type recombinase/integrase n=1 Tax=Fundidesulfovibrio agrisoli TaxID=2922717 RepID=UPI001FABDBE4|nr:site-specific integrase [Fundidesulfovibrio agrisoli]
MIRQKGNSWFVRWRENGAQKQKHFGIGPDAKLKAELYESEIKLAKKRGEDLAQKRHRQGLFFNELGQLYVDNLRATGRSENHIKNMVTLLNNVFVPLMPDRPVAELTFEHLLTFAGEFSGRAQSTRNRYMDYINAIFNFGVAHKLITENPMANWKKTREAKRDVQLTVEDLGRIIQQADPHLAWALEVSFNLGVRTGESELLALQWRQVDFDRSEIKVYAPKTKTWRIIPINPEFLERLRAKNAASVSSSIVEYKGKPVKSLRRSFRGACDKARIDYPVRFYDVRHLFCSTMLSKGAGLPAVSELMGHGNIKITNSYVHTQQIEKTRAVGLLPNITSV